MLSQTNINKYFNPVKKNTSSMPHTKALAYKYAFAYHYKYTTPDGTTEKAYKYYGFNSLDEFRELYNEAYEKRYCEICQSIIRHLYFDFDKIQIPLKLFNIKYFGDVLDEFITECGFNGTPTYKYMYVVEDNKNADEKVITSIHIIYDNVYADFKTIGDIVLGVNSKNITTPHIIHADPDVYDNNRNFRLFENTKVQQNRHFTSDYKGISIENTLVGTYNNEESNIEYKFDRPEKQKPSDIKEETTTPIVSNEVVNKTILLGNAEVIQYENIRDIVPSLIPRLNDVIFTRDRKSNWLTITYIIKKYKLYPLLEWCQMSVNRSGGEYTDIDNNIRYVNSLGDTRSGIPTLIGLFEELIPNIKIRRKYPTFDIYKICECIEDIGNFPIGSFSQNEAVITKFKEDMKPTPEGENNTTSIKVVNESIQGGHPYISFNRDTGNVKVGSKTDNYFINYQLRDSLASRDETFFNQYHSDVIEMGDIKDIETTEMVIDFMKKPNDTATPDIIAINSFCGSGKTNSVLRTALTYNNLNEKKPVLLITATNSLNIEMNNTINNDFKVSIKSHTKKGSDEGAIKEGDNVITSLESLVRSCSISKCRFGVVICDEFEAIISHLDSDTIKSMNARIEIFNKICEVLKYADKILILDALLSKNRIDILKRILKIDKIPLYQYSVNAYSDYNHNIIMDAKHFSNMILDKYQDECKKVALATDCKRESKIKFEEAIKMSLEIDQPRNIMLVNGEIITIVQVKDKVLCPKPLIEIIKGNKEDKTALYKTRNDIFENIESVIKKYDIHFFIYSPSITTGISINAEIFDTLYCYFQGGSIDGRTAVQMFYRPRRLTSKTINIHIHRKPSKLSKCIPLDGFQRYCEIPNNILTTTDVINVGEFGQFKPYKSDNTYYETRANNKYEALESLNNLYQSIFIMLTHKHNIRLNLVYAKDDELRMNRMADEVDQKEYKQYLEADITYKIGDEYYLNIDKFVNEANTINLQRNNETESSDAVIDYAYYLKFVSLIQGHIPLCRLESGEVEVSRLNGYFSFKDIIACEWSNEGVPYSKDDISIKLKVSKEWVQYISTFIFFKKCMSSYSKGVSRGIKKIMKGNADVGKYYITYPSNCGVVRYDTTDKRIEYTIKTSICNAFVRKMGDGVNTPIYDNHTYTDRLIDNGVIVYKDYSELVFEYTPLSDDKTSHSYISSDITTTITSRVMGAVKNQSQITNDCLEKLFSEPDIIEQTNRLYKITIPNYKPVDEIKGRKNTFQILSRVMSLCGYDMKYHDSRDTTNGDSIINITLKEGLYCRGIKYISDSKRFGIVESDGVYNNIVKFDNNIKNRNVNISISSKYLTRFERIECFSKEYIKENKISKEKVIENKEYVDVYQQVIFNKRAICLNPHFMAFNKVKSGKNEYIYKESPLSLNGDAVSLPLYRNIVKRFNNTADYVYYTPYQVIDIPIKKRIIQLNDDFKESSMCDMIDDIRNRQFRQHPHSIPL